MGHLVLPYCQLSLRHLAGTHFARDPVDNAAGVGETGR